MDNLTAPSGAQLKWLPVLAGMFFLAVATAASAAQSTKPCADDAANLCQGMKPGGGAVAKCLKEHASELSPACKANMAKAKHRAKGIKEVCKDDARNFCKDEKPGKGRIMRCLKQHEAELSDSCKAMVDMPKGKM